MKGGLTIYVDELVKEQISNGHRVSFFCNGDRNILFYPYLKKYHEGVSDNLAFYELVNSPNKFPNQRGRPLEEISNKSIEKIYKRVLDECKPDLVHIHELKGTTASLIGITKSRGIPVVFTLHGYWPLCSEVHLFDYKLESCTDFNNGYKCIPCNYSPASCYIKILLASKFKFLTKLYKNLKSIFLPRTKKIPTKLSSEENKILAEKYSLRRKLFIEKLNQCDCLIAVSQRVKEIYTGYEVNVKLLKVIKSPLCLDQGTVSHLKCLKNNSQRKDNDKINFCYRGGIIKLKGVHVLVEAFKHLDPKKTNLYVYGPSESDYVSALKKGSPENIFFEGRYEPSDLPSVMGNIDIGVTPSISEETGILVGLEFLSAGIPLIGSRIGCIPEYIIDGKNGFLFEPGNVEELAKLMQKFIDDRSLLPRLRANIDSEIKTMGRLYAEMDEIYNSLIKQPVPFLGRSDPINS